MILRENFHFQKNVVVSHVCGGLEPVIEPVVPFNYFSVPFLGLTTIFLVKFGDDRKSCETLSELASDSSVFTCGMGATALCSLLSWATLSSLLFLRTWPSCGLFCGLLSGRYRQNI